MIFAVCCQVCAVAQKPQKILARFRASPSEKFPASKRQDDILPIRDPGSTTRLRHHDLSAKLSLWYFLPDL
jgi:hypothetical protein